MGRHCCVEVAWSRWGVLVIGAAAAALVLGCSTPIVGTDAGSPDAGSPDAGDRDAPVLDGGMRLDAPLDGGIPLDAPLELDAPLGPDAPIELDAGPDAPALVDAPVGFDAPDAAPRDGGPDAPDAWIDCGGLTNCGGACVDLATSAANCGACGYAVIGGRTCVAGRPSPPWVSMPPDPPSDVAIHAWTGRHFMQVSSAGTYLFDPSTGAWTTLPGGAPPFQTGGRGPYFIEMPDRERVFVLGAPMGSGASPDRAWVFVDDASGPRWAGTYAVSARDSVDVAYDGRSVFVLGGNVGGSTPPPYTEPAGAVFDVATTTWSTGVTLLGNRVRAPTVALRDRTLVLLGGVTDSGAVASDPAAHFNLPPAATWSSTTVEGAITAWDSHVLLSVGDRALAVDDFTGHTFLVGPAGATRVTDLPLAGGDRRYAWVVFTGRAVLYWGGFSGTLFANGVAGVVGATGIDSWAALPTTGTPPAAARAPIADHTHHNAQRYWTGRELIVFGGWTDSGGTASSGDARYQPPVGCVCPVNADAPAWLATGCAGVVAASIVTAACVP